MLNVSSFDYSHSEHQPSENFAANPAAQVHAVASAKPRQTKATKTKLVTPDKSTIRRKPLAPAKSLTRSNSAACDTKTLVQPAKSAEETFVFNPCEYLPLVEALAKKVARRMNNVDRRDLISVGVLALYHCAERFESTRGSAFGAFAYARIWGAMIDESLRTAPLGRSAYRSQLRKRTGLSVYALENDHERIAATVGEASVEELYDRSVMTEKLRAALKDLPAAERKLVENHYYQEVTLEKVAQANRRDKSWASRLHSRVLTKLRDSLTIEPTRVAA